MAERTSPKLTTISQIEKPLEAGGNSFPHLRLNSENGQATDIPLLSLRNPDHHRMIAQVGSSGKEVIFVAGGVVGVLFAVERKDEPNPQNYPFWSIKPDRDVTSKLPILLAHHAQREIIDWQSVHPTLRFLGNDDARAALSGPFPLHVIWPFNQSDTLTDRTIFVTTQEDTSSFPEDMRVNLDTVCLFFQRDSDWLSVARITAESQNRRRWGVTSSNPHGKQPPFTLDELKKDILERSARGEAVWEIGAAAIVDDPIANEADVGSSHTQIRIQHTGEANLAGELDKPTIFVVRRGSLNPERLKEHIDRTFPGRDISVQTLPSAKVASRKSSPETDLYDRLQKQADLAGSKRSILSVPK